MLWSDPSDEPSEEWCAAEAKLRRAGKVLAAALMVLMVLLIF
ncbi:hypothetical protein AB0C51_04905 [Streptomyces pathocidini]|uniref:Morphogenic membrane protein MmpB n=1 Tax=Streptomyces pathocidini TaxID=1650571 RepID=A0ABW7USV8_9ACTN|nr:hypothetical protein [Streptomyces pathocidini]